MSLDVTAVQRALRRDGVGGWLLYDFHGSNPISSRLAGTGGNGHMATRRWFYFIPAEGEPQALVHAIERHNLDHLPGAKRIYAGRAQLEAGLRQLVSGASRVAMEYSPKNAIPYVSRVDAGTVEMVRECGVDVVSSGDLVQRFDALWNADAIASHREASRRLHRVKDRAFEAVAARVRGGVATTEYDIQSLMHEWFAEEGLGHEPALNVSAEEHAGDPHYVPARERSRAIGSNELVLIDLWGKMASPEAVYADITWVGFTGATVPAPMSQAFSAVAAARDAAVDLVQSAARDGGDLRGFEVDRAARQVLEAAGYGHAVLHRTGHSLGQQVHGDGAHLDDYETHDERQLLPGSGFTIEPGLYFDDFGVRSEINMVWGPGGPEVTGPRQSSILVLV
jgi:Xaa-Pro aminopeptidase